MQVTSQIKEAAITKLSEYGDPSKSDVATKPIDVVQKGVCSGSPFHFNFKLTEVACPSKAFYTSRVRPGLNSY